MNTLNQLLIDLEELLYEKAKLNLGMDDLSAKIKTVRFYIEKLAADRPKKKISKKKPEKNLCPDCGMPPGGGHTPDCKAVESNNYED